MLDIGVDSFEFSSPEKLKEILETAGCYDYIYLCSHGNKDGFELFLEGDKEKKGMSWSDFAFSMCESGCLNEGCSFLLACCRGGLNQVAWDMFIGCPQIDYICGPTWSLYNWDITTGFLVFIYNMEKKNAEPAYAAKKASLATDYTFMCFDRVEVESISAFNLRKEEFEEESDVT